MAKSWWNCSPPRPAGLCCDDLWRAMNSGTDGEGYGALIHWWDDFWMIGCGLPAPEYCPWCGSELKDPGPDGQGTTRGTSAARQGEG